MGTTKKIKFGELVLMNVSAIYGIRWIAKSTADSFGLGLAGIPSWVIFMFLCFVPQALMCAVHQRCCFKGNARGRKGE